MSIRCLLFCKKWIYTNRYASSGWIVWLAASCIAGCLWHLPRLKSWDSWAARQGSSPNRVWNSELCGFPQKATGVTFSWASSLCRLTNILVCIPSSFKCILLWSFTSCEAALSRGTCRGPRKTIIFRTQRLREDSFQLPAGAFLYFHASSKMQEKQL